MDALLMTGLRAIADHAEGLGAAARYESDQAKGENIEQRKQPGPQDYAHLDRLAAIEVHRRQEADAYAEIAKAVAAAANALAVVDYARAELARELAELDRREAIALDRQEGALHG